MIITNAFRYTLTASLKPNSLDNLITWSVSLGADDVPKLSANFYPTSSELGRIRVLHANPLLSMSKMLSVIVG